MSEPDEQCVVLQPRAISPSSLSNYAGGKLWSDLHLAVIDNRSPFISHRRGCAGGKRAEQCPVLRERFTLIQKLTEGMFRMLLQFLYQSDSQTMTEDDWNKFVKGKSLCWQEKGCKILHEAKLFLRSSFGWNLLGPPKVGQPPLLSLQPLSA